VASLVLSAGGLGHKAGGLRPPLASPAPTSLACPHQPRLPPPASLAPIGLACPRGEEEGSALVLGIGLRLWQSALSFPSLSFIYKSIVFLLFGSTDNSSSSLLLHHLPVSTPISTFYTPNCLALLNKRDISQRSEVN
jgi:hypothetical protein